MVESTYSGIMVVTGEESPDNEGHRGPSVGVRENRSSYQETAKGPFHSPVHGGFSEAVRYCACQFRRG